MKKLIYSTLALGLVFSLSSFSPIKKDKISINEIDVILHMEASSWTAYENSEYNPDRTVWTKRREVWDFSDTETNSMLETIITRN